MDPLSNDRLEYILDVIRDNVESARDAGKIVVGRYGKEGMVTLIHDKLGRLLEAGVGSSMSEIELWDMMIDLVCLAHMYLPEAQKIQVCEEERTRDIIRELEEGDLNEDS